MTRYLSKENENMSTKKKKKDFNTEMFLIILSVIAKKAGNSPNVHQQNEKTNCDIPI